MHYTSVIMEEKEYECFSNKEWRQTTREFRTIYCKFLRWDVFKGRDGRRIFVISLASPEEGIIAQSFLDDVEALKKLRSALNELLEPDDVMYC